MADYRYIFLSLRDEVIIEEIPLFGVFAQRLLNAPGQFNGTYQLDQTGKNNIDLVGATIPGKCWMVMERDDVPVWWGIVWSRTYQSQSKSVQLYCTGFEIYPTHQLVLTNFTRNGINQLQIFIDLWSEMQASAPGRNMNINMPTSIPSSITKDVKVLAVDRKYYIDSMNAIANAADGFDWTIDVTRYGSGYKKNLLIGYPILGSLFTADSLTFDYPGNILNYYETEGMPRAGTHIFGFGAGEGEAQLFSAVAYDDMVNDLGWPRWDNEISLKDINDQKALDGLTLQHAIKAKPPQNTYTLSLKSDLDPIFGSYGLGDACTLSIHDAKHPDLFQIQTRIVGWELTPASSTSTDEVKLVLPGDDVNGKIPVAAQ